MEGEGGLEKSKVNKISTRPFDFGVKKRLKIVLLRS